MKKMYMDKEKRYMEKEVKKKYTKEVPSNQNVTHS